ncbi:hypothetical protein MTAT_14040 [Moorella thermoacetica]|uniref:Copper amine oxidase-like N-terminal domain-containing protein n=1 Tax=Neomoorella thermoacetica TaxID=1525 RepID=A0AAC9MUM5_NEOTH|nr:copper amine oxidase N-terminal domain-containing protein [Moorella thermoacetica]AOQ23819.1 hypothetical protein Maut_01371 [Moorella thermoacetica]TYL14004.1 hypothetical protein MTAT_14040 [Moorella thermoacetica]
MKKAAFIISMVFALLFGGIAIARAGENIRIFVNGQEVYSDVPPQVVEGRTMVPLRAVGEALGADVRWDDVLSSVIVTTNNAEESEKEQYVIGLKRVNALIQQLVTLQKSQTTNVNDYSNISNLREQSAILTDLINYIVSIHPPKEASVEFNQQLVNFVQARASVDVWIRSLEEWQRGNFLAAQALMDEAAKLNTQRLSSSSQ